MILHANSITNTLHTHLHTVFYYYQNESYIVKKLYFQFLWDKKY